MTKDDVSAVFSTTEAVTGVCIMPLVEAGKIALTDLVSRCAPKQQATVNDPMLHASG